MRLIDADKLQEHFEKVKKESARLVDVAQIIGVQSVIDSQPTAYDVDKVCREISENRDMDNMIDVDHAIKIIKSEMKG